MRPFRWQLGRLAWTYWGDVGATITINDWIRGVQFRWRRVWKGLYWLKAVELHSSWMDGMDSMPEDLA